MAANQQQFPAPQQFVPPPAQAAPPVQQQYAAPQQQQYAAPAPVADIDPYEPNKPFSLGNNSMANLSAPLQNAPAPQPQQFGLPQQPQQFQQPQGQYNGFAPNGMPIPAGNLPIVPPPMLPQYPSAPAQQFGQAPMAQQTMAYNQLNTMQQQAQLQGQQLLGADTNNPMLQAMVESNKQTQAALQQLIESQRVAVTTAQQSNEPNYLEMDNQVLVELMLGNADEGKAPRVKEILAAVAKQAGSSVNESLQAELNQQKGLMEAVLKQHTTNQVKMQISTLQQNYSQRDPMFDNNMVEAAQFLETPQGKAYYNMFPENALETAYLTVQAQKLNNPQYQQQLAYQLQNQQYQQHQQKLQGGMQGGYTQTATPFPMMQTQAVQPQGKSDFDVIADILRVGGYGGFNVPNVRPVMAA